MKRPTWNDLMNGSPKDLKRIYKLNERQLEQAVRGHMKDAPREEIKKTYEKVYDKRKD